MQSQKRVFYGLICVLLFTLAACGGTTTTTTTTTTGAAIEVRDPWVRPAVVGSETMDNQMAEHGHAGDDSMDHSGHSGYAGGRNSAAYMTLVNNGNTADRLISATTDVAQVVELHTVEMEGNVMKMRPVEQIDIPANGQVELRPGGLHVMLIDLKQSLKEGDTVNLTLILEHAGEIAVQAPVRQP